MVVAVQRERRAIVRRNIFLWLYAASARRQAREKMSGRDEVTRSTPLASARAPLVRANLQYSFPPSHYADDELWYVIIELRYVIMTIPRSVALNLSLVRGVRPICADPDRRALRALRLQQFSRALLCLSRPCR